MLGVQIKCSTVHQNVTVTNFSKPQLLITTNGSKKKKPLWLGTENMTQKREDTTHISDSINQQTKDSTNYTHLIHSPAQHNLHVFQITRFGPLDKPPPDLHNVKKFVKKNHPKPIYVYMT